jgi:hypothetical protein
LLASPRQQQQDPQEDPQEEEEEEELRLAGIGNITIVLFEGITQP